MKSLIVKNITKLYDESHGIKDLSFELLEKECLAIIGKSGTGKSTLIKTILNILTLDKGSIKFYDTNLNDNYVDIMKIVGYLADKPINFPKTTIDKFIKVINDYYNQDYTNDILHYLDLFKLNKNSIMTSLSSGEIQKLSFILAIFHKPKILFLDEPTNFLDTNTIHLITRVLKELKYEGTSIIICSHSLDFVLDLADRIYLLDDFKLIDIKDKLLKKDYKKITLATNTPLTYKDLNIEGISNIKINDKVADFIYIGDLNYLLKKLSHFNLIDITLENPSIDEVLGGLLNVL